MEIAKDSIKFLHDGGEPSSDTVPGFASSAPSLNAEAIQKMDYKQLRDLASRTPNVQRDKKTPTGKWIPKISKELRADLCQKIERSTQVQPGQGLDRKRLVTAAPSRPIIKKRPAATDALRGRQAILKRPATTL